MLPDSKSGEMYPPINLCYSKEVKVIFFQYQGQGRFSIKSDKMYMYSWNTNCKLVMSSLNLKENIKNCTY